MAEEKNSIIHSKIIAINLGLRQFAESLEAQDVEVAHVNWSPPSGGDEEMQELLEKLL